MQRPKIGQQKDLSNKLSQNCNYDKQSVGKIPPFLLRKAEEIFGGFRTSIGCWVVCGRNPLCVTWTSSAGGLVVFILGFLKGRFWRFWALRLILGEEKLGDPSFAVHPFLVGLVLRYIHLWVGKLLVFRLEGVPTRSRNARRKAGDFLLFCSKFGPHHVFMILSIHGTSHISFNI